MISFTPIVSGNRLIMFTIKFILLMCITTPFAQADIVEKFSEINEFLKDYVVTSDVKRNIIGARDWLNQLNEDNSTDVELHSALELFISLSTVMKGSNCSEENSKIILENHLACGKKTRLASTEQRHIDKLVHRIATKCALDCEPVWEERYRGQKAKIDKNIIHCVDTALNNLLDSHLSNSHPLTVYKAYITNWYQVGGELDAKLVYEGLSELTRDDPNNKYLRPILSEDGATASVDKDKLVAIINQYLLTPCGVYTNQLSKGALGPATNDLNVKNRDIPRNETHVNNDFYRDWAKTRLCRSIIKNMQSFIRDLYKESIKHEATH